MRGVCRHLPSFLSMRDTPDFQPSKAMLVCCVLLCLSASQWSPLVTANPTARGLPHTNPLTVLHDSGDEEDSTAVSSNRGTGGGRLSPDDVLTPESGEPYEVTEKQYLRGDWCKTLPLRQRIDSPGCISRTITNRFCYGQCNSFYIPKQSLEFNDAFRSCSFCKPYRTTTFTVTLRCPGQTPSIQRMRVEKVKQCRCVAVDVS